MTKLDLKDAYLTVPVATTNRKFLHFIWDKKIYEFISLPFRCFFCPMGIYQVTITGCCLFLSST